MNKPVILLAFANDKVDNTRYLRDLPLESDGLRKALQPAVRAGLCEVVERVNVTVEQILDIFQSAEYRDRIAGLHYGGHADGYQLLLESLDGSHSVAHGGGLVSFLAGQPSLKFVFFNGCSTEQQTLELVEAGVPAVVGTSSSVNDEIATGLAVRFYKSLGQGAKLQRAWNEAVDQIKIEHGAETKALYRRKRGETPPETFPWNLHIRPGGEAVCDWNLADAADSPLFGLPDLPAENLPETPYRFLERYKKEQAEILFGRSYYIRDLYKRTEDPGSAPVILLYGQSGVGKSSLLDAGLLPRLEQNFRVVYIRREAGIGLAGTLKKALGIPTDSSSKEEIQNPLLPEIQVIDSKIEKAKRFAQELPEDARSGIFQSVELLQKKKSDLEKRAGKTFSAAQSPAEIWKKTEEATGRPLIILLDQAEEVFTRSNKNLTEEFENFLEQTADIFNKVQSRPAGKLILSYRKEYHPEIKEGFVNAGIPREEIFLKALDRKDIVEVVSGLTLSDRLRRTYRLNVEAELPGIIADDLLEDKESPIAPALQILLTKMWQLTENEEVRVFTVEKYQELRRAGILMDDFFYDQMEKFRTAFPEDDKSGLALDVLFAHTTRLGTADSRNLDDIRAMYNLRQETIDRLIDEFKNLYLLTEAGTIMTDLAHDTLAPVVVQEFRTSDRPGQRAAIILQNKISAYEHNPNNLIDENDLQIVEEGAGGMRILTQKEQELVEASQRKRARNRRNRKLIRAAGIALVSVILLMTAVGFFYQQQVAVEQARAAEKQKELAIKAQEESEKARLSEKTAEKEKEKAVSARTEAEENAELARKKSDEAESALRRQILILENNIKTFITKYEIVDARKELSKIKVLNFSSSAFVNHLEKIISDSLKSVSPVMVIVEGGTFMMGYDSLRDEFGDRKIIFSPLHSETVKTFAIGQTEITQGLWKKIMGNNPSEFTRGDSNPVENVSFEEAEEFLKVMERKTGLKFRLPLETEWEFAARGGNKSKGFRYAGSDDLEEVAKWDNSFDKATEPVAQRKPNELGLYDMNGNVEEICIQGAPGYTATEGMLDFYNGDFGSVLRGGSWSSSDIGCAPYVRNLGFKNNERRSEVGFRLAADVVR